MPVPVHCGDRLSVFMSKLFVDFSQGSSDVFAINTFNDVETFTFKYDIRPEGITDVLTVKLMGQNFGDSELLWHENIFVELNRTSEFKIKFDGLNKYQTLSLHAIRGNNDIMGAGSLTIEAVPEPSAILLVGSVGLFMMIRKIWQKAYCFAIHKNLFYLVNRFFS